MHETKSSENILEVFLCAEQPKANVYEGYVLLILHYGIPCLLIVFLFLQPSPYVHINLSHVS